MSILFEYGHWENVSNAQFLKRMLRDIWQQSLIVDTESERQIDEEGQDNRFQPFLKFDGNQIKL
jgi:hypothetical protein